MSRYTHAHTAMDRRFLSLSPSSSSITHACLPVCARSVTRWRGGGRASLLAGGNLTLASEAVVSHIRQESLYSRARACARVSHQHTSSHRRIGGGGSDGATRQNATRPLTSTGTVGEARALLVYHHHHHLSLTEERVESWRRRRHALASHHSLSPPTLALLGGVDARSETAVGGGCEATRNRLVTHTHNSFTAPPSDTRVSHASIPHPSADAPAAETRRACLGGGDRAVAVTRDPRTDVATGKSRRRNVRSKDS